MLNEILLPAMKEVGDKFGAGELILPFVLQSAEVMKKAVAHLEQFLEKKEGSTKGTVVLATVFGDVHDIGKNLVNTILTNNGYTVHDLGKQVPMNTILDKAVEVNADAIGLSALLVSTSKQMPICVQEQDTRGLRSRSSLAVPRSIVISDDVSRCSTTASASSSPACSMRRMRSKGSTSWNVSRATGRARRVRGRFATRFLRSATSARRRGDRARNAISAVKGEHADIPPPPFWGGRTIDEVDLRELWPWFDLKSLYRLSWGASNTKGEAFDELVRDDFEPRLRHYQPKPSKVVCSIRRSPTGIFQPRASATT